CLEHETRQGRIADRAGFGGWEHHILDREGDHILIRLVDRFQMSQARVIAVEHKMLWILGLLVHRIGGKHAAIVLDMRLLQEFSGLGQGFVPGFAETLRVILETHAYGRSVKPSVVIQVDDEDLGIGKARSVLYAKLLEGEISTIR